MSKMSRLHLRQLRTHISRDDQVAAENAATSDAIANAPLTIDLLVVKGVLCTTQWTNVLSQVIVAMQVLFKTILLEPNRVVAEERTRDEEVVHTVIVGEEGDFTKEVEIVEGMAVDDITMEAETLVETEVVDTRMGTEMADAIEEDVITKEEDTVDEKSEETATTGLEIADETVGVMTVTAMMVEHIRMEADTAEEVAGDVTKTEEEIVDETAVDGTTMGVDLVMLPLLVKVELGTARERLSWENLRW